MKVWLLSKERIVRTLWLPPKIDGHYSFSEESLPIRIPLSILAERNAWVCRAEGSALFLIKDGAGAERKTREAPLADGIVLKILSEGDTYLLYAEESVQNADTYFLYDFDVTETYRIGSQADCQVQYKQAYVSREHAALHWEDGHWRVTDCASMIGTYVNGRRTDSCALHPGDSVFIMGLSILIGSGFLAMNNSGQRVFLHSPFIRRREGDANLSFLECPERQESRNLFERQPRKRVRIHKDSIPIEMPPMPLTASKIPLLLRLGSPMLMGGRALATGNVLSAMTSLVLPAMTQGLTEKDRKEYEAKRTSGYRQYLKEVEEEIRQETSQEQNRLNETYPYLTEVMRHAMSKTRLWERRKNDDDFLQIRIGSGQFPLMAKREFQERHFELEPDELTEEMYQIAEAPVMLKNVPVMLDLKRDYIVGVPGPARGLNALIRNMILNLALTHSYDEVKIVLLTDETDGEYFEFTRYLPHVWDNDRTIRFCVSTPSDALKIGEYLSKETETILGNSGKDEALRRNPSYVVFALSKRLFDRVEVFKELMFQQEYCGVSIVAAFEGVPKDCKKLIELRSGVKLIDLTQIDAQDVPFSPDSFDADTARESVMELTKTKLLIGSEAFALPDLVTFLQMHHAGMLKDLNVLENWDWKKENLKYNPFKSLAAPIGVGTDGQLFKLDLHEKAHGPHGLVAGTTGSGKSEFLMTYILSMAVLYSPELVSFALIDYKGGGLTDAFEFTDKETEKKYCLPHLAGTITNLDGASIQRSIMSIESEIRRREALFQEANALSNEGKIEIYEYQKLYREGKVSTPLPHLFIIADEFAELRSKEQAFMDTLISITRVGRSLGMHLILATQKPGGIVSPEMWSNMKTHVCLRVQERTDSMDMLKRPEAMELRQSGRFYLQVGNNEYFALGQSAWCGADYFPQEEISAKQDEAIQFLDNAGQVILTRKQNLNKGKAQAKQLSAIVKYLVELGEAQKLSSPKLWSDPLPKQIDLTTLLAEAALEAEKKRKNEEYIPTEEWQSAWPTVKTMQPPEGYKMPALIGMVDNPGNQTQFPLYVDMLSFYNLLLVGNAGSGKSTFIRTLLYSLLEHYSPKELSYYILDLSNEALSAYKNMPHCGAYLTIENEADVGRMFKLLRDIMDERKKLFAEKGVTAFAAYQAAYHDLPLILVIIDGFTNLPSIKNGSNYHSSFHEFLREGSNFGVRYLLSCNHYNEVSARAKQELDCRFSVQAKDRYDYGDILNMTHTSFEPPPCAGRGMCAWNGKPLEYHAAMLDCAASEQERSQLLRARLERLKERYRNDGAARKLDMPDTEKTYEEFCAAFPDERIPLGYTAAERKAVAIPFQQLYHVSLYMGNPAGRRLLFQNMMTAARFNRMDTLILKRQRDSVFDNIGEDKLSLPDGAEVMPCTADTLAVLQKKIEEELRARIVHRNKYCVDNGLPEPYTQMAVKAARYIREKTKPLLIVLESFADFCAAENAAKEGEKSYEAVFQSFFAKLKGFNIYFLAGFYPDDPEEISSHPFAKAFNPDRFLMLFGGRFDRYALRDNSADGILRRDEYAKMGKRLNRGLVKYNAEFYGVIMPSGKLEEEKADPDEAPIF